MKKNFLLFAALLLSLSSFATAWRTNVAGAANTLANWRDVATGLVTPASFATVGDTWNIQNNMTINSATWNLAGTLTATSSRLYETGTGSTVNIGGNLSLSGGAHMGSTAGGDLTINLTGNLSMTGTSYFINTPAFNYINFVNTSSTLGSPQTITYSSTSAAGNYTYYTVNSGCVAQLNSNFAMNGGGAFYGEFNVNGSLVCQTYVLSDDASSSFTLASGASLYTANVGGVSSSVTVSTSTFNAGANYIFNGTSAQVTSAGMPAALVSPSTLTINNSAGVTLSQATSTTGTLAFTSGTLNTGGTSMTTPGAATAVTGAGASSYVIGILKKTITGYTSVNYEVGDADYAPMLLTFSSAGTAGSLGVVTTAGLHPAVASSFLNSAAMANHYWTVSNTGAAGPVTVTPKLTYNVGDILGGSNASFVTQEYNGTAWLSSYLASTNTSSPYTTTPTTGVTLATLAGDYICGNHVPFCSSTPTAGTANISPSLGNATTLFALSLTGTSVGLGITFQWQSSTTGLGGSWSNIGGATNSSYGFTGITVNTYFRCVVTCPSYSADTSTSIMALYMSCIPAAGSSWTNSLSVTKSYTGALQTWTVPAGVVSINVDAQGATGGGVNAYDTYQSIGGNGGRVQATLSVTAGHVLNIVVGGQGVHVSPGTGGYGGGGSCVAFSATWPGAGGGGASSIVDNTTATKLLFAGGGGGGGGDIAGADIGGAGGGLTGASGASSICTTGGLGGTQTAGGAGEVCTYIGGTGSAGTGGAGGATEGSGGGGGGYFGGGGGAFGGGGGGGSSYTNPTYATAVTHTQGYNSTGNGVVVITGYYDNPINGVNAFNVTGALSTSLSDVGISAAVNPSSGYANHTSISPVVLLQGGVYASSVTWGTVLSYQEAQVWIDFNNDGLYQTTEEVTGVVGYSTTSTPSPTTFNITIPTTAPLGIHTMRMRGIQEDGAAARSLSTHLDPCLSNYLGVAPNYLNGDIVDYDVNIQPNGCSGTPVAGTVSATVSTGCSAYTSVLSLTGATVTTGLTYQWASSSDDVSWSIITGATASTYTVTVTSTMYYRCTITCTTSGLSASTPGALLSLPVIGAIAPGSPDSICIGATTTLTDTTTGVSWSSSSTGIATVGSSTGVVTGVAAGVVTITCGVSGCNATTVITVNGAPSAIVGATSVCISGTTTLTDATAGGTWSSGTSTVASIGSSTGIVNGLLAGTTIITYTALCGTATLTLNVIDVPASITGAGSVCVGSSTLTLADATTGGTWSSLALGTATIGSGTGIVTGVAAGTVTIDYTTACGNTTTVVTVNGSPASITGTPYVCVGSITTLADDTIGGTWTSGTTTVATVDATGDVSGASQGISIITYSNGCGTAATMTVTVNAAPAPIAGIMTVCIGSVTTLTNTSTGGTWTSGTTTIATVDATGDVTGIAQGTSIITYSNGCGTDVYATVTVNAVPATITGTPYVCVGSITTLANTSTGGTWTSGTTTVATVDASGDVSGASQGTSIITYANGCGTGATMTVTVNAAPAAIAGTMTVCIGSVTTLTNTSTGGTWTSGTTTIATIDATGDVTGIAQGTSIITYSNGCGADVYATVTVNAVPAIITGSSTVCSGSMITLADIIPGGTWSSSATGTATVDATGDVTGVAAGIVTITYSTGCGADATTTITVNPTPTAITGSLSLCGGTTSTLSDTAPGGTWTSTVTSVATIDGTTGVLTAVSTGSTTISYTNTCGTVTALAIVNSVPPVAITGVTEFCAGIVEDTVYDATPGGTWSSSTTSVATIDAGGAITGISGGTTTISYSTGCGAPATISITVLPLPSVITGTGSICIGGTITLLDSIAGGTWSSTGTYATIGSGTGIATGIAAGIENITYTTGCGSVYATITVNGAPATITGTPTICVSSTTALANTATGGTWTSGTTTVATVDALGAVTGVAQGTSIITYSNGCGANATQTVTVYAAPATTTGTASVCASSTTLLSNTSTGGTWTSSTTTIATVDAGGNVTGVSAGTAIITYSTGCGSDAYTMVTVNGAPSAITGGNTVCIASTTTLSDSVAGGTWTSGTTSVATVDATGDVTGITLGTTLITYSTGCGADATFLVTVSNSPAIITGAFTVCEGGTTTLGDASGGGTWVSGSIANATIGTTGIVTGVSAGIATISYITGCGTATQDITVNITPAAITGTVSLCAGLTDTLADATTTGSFSSTIPGIATIDAVTGIVNAIATGTTTISYTLTTGCYATSVFTVNAAPSAGTISGLNNVCVGSNISLTDAAVGGTIAWSSSNTLIATVAGGVVSGVAAGAATISYSVTNGCGTATTTYSITVNPLPDSGTITGSNSICFGASVLLADGSAGGVWTSSNPLIASVDGLGNVTGNGAGSASISYTVTNGCGVANATPFTVTVYTAPSPITGTLVICASSNTTLASSPIGGVWSSSNTAIATIDATLGVATGVAGGGAIITYTTSCGSAYANISINPLPSIITGSPSVCLGGTTTLSDSIIGGTWVSSVPGNASIDITGVVTGNTVGNSVISYTTGCGMVTVNVTVNPLPSAITGLSSVCPYFTITLSDVGSGTWASSTSTIATVSGTGVVTGVSPGVDTIKYTLGTGCSSTKLVTVYPFTNAGVITGLDTVCVGTTISLVDTNFGGAGTWASSAIGTATVSGGVVTGIAAGTVNISYSGTYGCSTGTVHKTITVRPQPFAGTITGATSMCLGTPLSLTDSGVVGGTWSSTTTGVATVTTTGVVTAVSIGVDTIKYTSSNSCGTQIATHIVNVRGVPAAITGSTMVCAGGTDTLSNTTIGGTWSTSDLGTDTFVAGGFGVVYGVAAGVSTITYATGCGTAATITFTVNPLPDAGTISGTASMCAGSSSTLTETSSTGVWSVSNSNATVTTGGIVTGVVAGLDTVLYNASNVCGFAITQIVVTINPLAVAGTLTGPDSVCVGTTITLIPSLAGGTWTALNGFATVAGGVVTGVSAGIDSIIYTATTVCGSASVSIGMVVTPLPVAGAITGTLHVCAGSTTSLTDGVTGGVWSSSSISIATVAGGVVSGLVAGVDTIFYTVTNSCNTAVASQLITVNPLPIASLIEGGDTVCTSGTLTLTDVITDGTWSSTNSINATVNTIGVVSGLTTGMDTILYTVTSIYCGNAVAHDYVFVAPIPNAGIISGDSVICVLTSATLMDSVTGGVWTSAGIITSVLGNIVHGNAGGIDTITYTITTTCGMAHTTYTIAVDSPLNPNINGLSYVCIGGRTNDTLSGTPAGGIWSMSNTKAFNIGHIVYADTSITATSGFDTAIYTVSNICGMVSIEKSITVNSKGNCDTMSSVNMVNANDGTIKIYPNPSAGAFTVELPELGANTSITVMDIYGKVIELREIKDSNTNKFEFNFNNLASGTYLIKVTSNNNIYNGKVLIMNR